MGLTFVLIFFSKCYKGIMTIITCVLNKVSEILLDWRLPNWFTPNPVPWLTQRDFYHYGARPLNAWDWIFAGIVTASWGVFIFWALRGSGSIIRRKSNSKANFIIDLKFVGLGVALAFLWYGIRSLLKLWHVPLDECPLIPTAAFGRWWRLFPVPLGLFKIGGALLTIGKFIAKKVSWMPTHVSRGVDDMVSLARDLAEEE